MAVTVAVITIGQTPRVDMMPSIRAIMPKETIIIERGVLDERTEEEIKELAPEPGQTTLVSRLRDGHSTIMGKEKIIPLVQAIIGDLQEKEISLIILACTGKFPEFQSSIPVIYPDYLLNYVVKGLFREGLLGVILPLPEQEEVIKRKWGEANFQVIPSTCSPYKFNKSELIESVIKINQFPVKAIVLDCMGYTEEMKEIVQNHTTKPVLLSRKVIYQTATELL